MLQAVLISGAAGALLVLMEWLFFATKPSMFSTLEWPQRVSVLLSSLLPVTLAFGLLSLLAQLPAFAWRPQRGRRLAEGLVGWVPSAALTVTAFLLVENFTNTVLGFNVGSFDSPARYLYAAGCLVALVLFRRKAVRWQAEGALSRWRRAAAIAGIGLLGVSLAAAAARYLPEQAADPGPGERAARRPNILILSTDGVEAGQMSVYGYERPTTPFLDSRVEEFLVSENHFTNSPTTASSAGALLTGKLPTTTGVTQQLDTFQGRDIYEHLPGVLRRLGYYGIEVGAPYYADSLAQNLREGFHVSNSRRLVAGTLAPVRWYGRRFPTERHFLGSIAERVRERLAHAFGVADMAETDMVRAAEWRISDRHRISTLERDIARASRPFFAYVHLLNTHGPEFRFERQVFSAGQQPEAWDPDSLDDAILEFDGYVARIFRLLEETGELENTVVVINSDHGVRWSAVQRLPLLIRFPGGEHRGRIEENTQRIDIAPTLLDYLGVDAPEWMEGRSILGGEIDPKRAILIAGMSESPSYLPMLLIQCQWWARLQPDSGSLQVAEIQEHTAPCPESERPEEAARLEAIIAELERSPYFVAPFRLGIKLYDLIAESDPELRRTVAEAIRSGLTEARPLADGLLLARAFPDAWTQATSPAALLAINEGAQPMAPRLEIRSGIQRKFPLAFHIEDGETTHHYRFERSGSMRLELAPVPPGSDRLYIVWSDRAAQRKHRKVGVLLRPVEGP